MRNIVLKACYVLCLAILIEIATILVVANSYATVPASTNYCSIPPFTAQTVPPLLLINMSKDHKLYYNAYNDGSDLDEDGRIDNDYKHSIDYYGYFDPIKCYTYDTTNKRFNPVGFSATGTNAYSLQKYGHQYSKFCSAGQWSGNVLNWLTMTRMDVLRKVLYGGHRSTDDGPVGNSKSAQTVLERVYVPRDAHSWAKEFTGRLCSTTSPDADKPKYTTTCVTSADCDANIGYTECTDVSNQLIGIAQSPQPTPCGSSVTVSNVNDKMLLVRYSHQSTLDSAVANGDNHTDLLSSFDPLSLLSTSPYTMISDFNDPLLSHSISDSNMIVVAEFNVNTTTDLGKWLFMVDGDDGVELEIFPPTGTAQIRTLIAGAYAAAGQPQCFSSSTIPTANTVCDTSWDGSIVGTTNICDGSTSAPDLQMEVCSQLAPDPASPGIPNGFRPTNGGWYRLVARETNRIGLANLRVWYKKPSATQSTDDWKLFSSANLGSGKMRAPNITSSNVCSVKTMDFIQTGVPTTTAVTTQRHLFCSVTDTDTGPPLLKLKKNSTLRLWDWGATEAPVCSWRIFGGSDTSTPASTDTTWAQYEVRAKVCDTNYMDNATNFENCKQYKKKDGSTYAWKPTGLLQKYGEGDPNDKVCSRTFSKSCSQDSDCTTATEGLCINRSKIYYGLMTGSYKKNLSGGVLRKDISSIMDELNYDSDGYTDGTLATSTKPQGNIIKTIDAFKITNYSSTNSNYNNCTAFVRQDSITEGKCENWGNPVAEMMYEGLRYFAGKAVPNSSYDTDDSTTYSFMPAKQGWGIPKSGTTSPLLQPYGTTNDTTLDTSDPLNPKLSRTNAIFPVCSKPFMMVLSDINPSFDGDQLPKSAYNTSYAEDSNKPLLQMNVAKLDDIIGKNENLENTHWFIGQSSLDSSDPINYSNDLCTSKLIANSDTGNMSLLRGLCPEEPTRKGTYYSAAIAYYAKTRLQYALSDDDGTIRTDSGGHKIKSGIPSMTTYAVPLASPIPQLNVKLGDNYINIVPFGKAVYWSGSFDASCWNKNSKYVDNDGLRLFSPQSGSYCGGEQIVPLYVDEVRYDTSNNLLYGNFRINFEDSEQGNDHDMDAIVGYEICTKSSVDNGYGGGCKVCSNTQNNPSNTSTNYYPTRCTLDSDCGTGNSCQSVSLGSNQIMLTVTSISASAGIDSALGFVVSGTLGNRLHGEPASSSTKSPNDGAYLVVANATNRTTAQLYAGDSTCKDPDSNTARGIKYKWSKVFTTSGSATNLLKDPLWFAAKWGGFQDGNGNNIPDKRTEWAMNCTATDSSKCDPDNYYLVVNPLKLESQMDKALTDILAKTSSGTAASIVNKRQESGANILTAVFYPERDFDNGTKINWAGDLQNYWYYFDPYFSNSGLIEDTKTDSKLNLLDDYKVDLSFDTNLNRTVANRYKYDGKNYNFISSEDPQSIHSLWKAGDNLFYRTSSRTIYTNIDSPNTSATPKDYSASFLSNNFSTTNASTLQPYLQAASSDEAVTLIKYTQGITDNPTSGTYTPTYRGRTVTYNSTSGIWKLGDIVSSTPRIQSSIPVNNYHQGYGDTSYSSYINSSNYKNNGTVYVGANDGMLHAFSLGKISSLNTGYDKAQISDNGSAMRGSEQWAFIPRNALPYLRYLTDPSYQHVFTVDLTPTLVDASINCSTAPYENCIRSTNFSGTSLDLDNTSWRTIMIGGMGIGGASRSANGTCNSTTTVGTTTYQDCIKAPINTSGYTDVGLSSYFALDVTQPSSPKLMWEFSDPNLGLAMVDPVIVRINGVTTIPGKNNVDTNGKWFAVFASGPTGPINTSTHQFYGRSDQKLKLFVIDLATGKLVRTFDLSSETNVSTNIKSANAFGASMASNAIDVTADNSASASYYSTDVIYIGYVRQKLSSGSFSWENGYDGGLLRLLTNDNPDPNNWTLSSLIDGTGPITSSIAKMTDALDQSTFKPELWLYFGSGRYFYKDLTIDSADEVQSLFGIKEPCYRRSIPTDSNSPKIIDPVCSSDSTKGQIYLPARNSDGSQNDFGSDLFDSTYILSLDNNYYESTFYKATTPKKGWFATLDSSSSDFTAERVITTPLIRTSGITIFTTFKPTADVCSFGGKTFENIRNYRTGGLPPAGALRGKITIQLSTGAIVTTDLGNFYQNLKVGDKPPVIDVGMGKPPSQPPQDDRPRKPIRKILHIQEK